MWRRVWIAKRRLPSGVTHQLRWYGADGKERAESVGPDKRHAENQRRAREQELNYGLLDAAPACRLSLFDIEYFKLRAGQAQPSTLTGERALLKRFRAHVGDVRLDAITPRDVQGYIAGRTKTCSPATVNGDLRTLKAILTRAVEWGFLKENPAAKIRKLREPEKDLRILTPPEVKTLLAACPDERWRLFVALAVTTGLRRGELIRLDWTDIDFDRALLYVRNKEAGRTKTGKQRIVPIPAPTLDALRRFKMRHGRGRPFANAKGAPWVSNFPRVFKRLVERGEIPHCTVHDLRRTYCSHLAMAGVPEAVTQTLAGHASPNTTRKHYIGVLPDVVTGAPDRLPYLEAVAVRTYSAHRHAAARKAKTA